VYFFNRTISNSEIITPYQRWFGKSHDISNLRVFGSVAYFFPPDVLRQKLYPKATKGVYVGESEEQKASRVFVEATGCTHISRYIKVYEDLPYWLASPLPVPTTLSTHSILLTNVDTPDSVYSATPDKSSSYPSASGSSCCSTGSKTLRGLVPKKIFQIEMTGACAVHLSPSLSMSALISTAFKATSLFYEPKTFTEAMSGAKGDLWHPAADYEMAAHIKNQTWTLVPLPHWRTCIPSGWDLKTDKLGLPCRRKARFFVKGYRQV
jgi:hypothetical protein